MKSSALHGSNAAAGQLPRQGGSFIDPGALMRIKNLELRAKIVVEGFMSGLHRSPYHGFSVEFSEYRQYSPGDDPRYLDWRLLARTDRYYIKRFEEETNLRCHLLVDMSRSMAFGTLGHDKLEYARTIAATVAYFLSLQRDAVGLMAFDAGVVEYLPPRYRPGHLHRLMLALGRPAAGKATDVDAALERTAALLTKRGLVLLISDLLAPTDKLEKNLGYLRTRGHEVVVLRVLDPSEVDFTFDAPAMFHDVESGRELYVDPASVRSDYQRRFNEHAAAIRQTCLNLGVDYSTISTADPLELALFDFLHARQRRGGKRAAFGQSRGQRRDGRPQMSVLFWAFLGGTAAVAFPLLFHLIRRTPRGRQEFSATMFLRPSPPRLTRRSRLDHLLLLFLRAAAIVLIALAFMRPFWRAADEKLADPPGRRVALLVDVSASMKRGDLWRQAMAQAEKTIGELEAADDVALFAFDDQFRPIVPFDRDVSADRDIKRTIVREKLKELSPSWAHTDLGSALVSAADALASIADVSAKDAVATSQIIVVTDMQEGAKLDALGAFEWPAQVQVDVRAVSAPGSSNARVALLDDDSTALVPGEPRVRVWNADDSATEQFRVAWAKPTTGDRDLNAHAAAFYVPPGQSRVLPVPRGNDLAAADRLMLLGDDEPFDNAFFVAPRVQREVHAVGVGRDLEDDAQGLRYYLARAVAETPRRKVSFDWRAPGGDLEDLAILRPHLVCVTDGLSAGENDAIRKYVDAGGTALVVLRGVEAAKALATLIGAKEAKEHENAAATREYAMLGQIDFAHPLFAQFSAARYSDFTKIRFWRRRTVTLDETAQSQIIAKFDDGSPAIWQRLVGKGHVVAFASGWHPRDSQWALSTKFVPIMSSLFDRVGPRTSMDAALVVHEAVPLPDATPQEAQTTGIADRAIERVVQKPDGAKIVLPQAATTFDATDSPGVYRFTSGEESWSFAVNLAPRESDTAPLEPARLEALGVKLGMQLSSSEKADRDRQLRDTELESRQKIWKWLIVGALCVLGMETLLAGWRSRAPAAPLGEPA